MNTKWNLTLGFLLSGVLFCAGCGKQEETEAPNDNSYNWSTELRAAETLSDEEVEIATNICESFQKMRAFVSTNGGKLSLDFAVQVRECGSDKYDKDESASIINSRSDGVYLEPHSSSSDLVSDVYSDEHERLAYICDAVLSGTVPTNTIEDGSLRYQVSFFTDSGYEWLQVAEFSDQGGVFYPYLIEIAGVVTPYSGANSDTYGFTKVRGINRPCSDDSTSYVIQDWQ